MLWICCNETTTWDFYDTFVSHSIYRSLMTLTDACSWHSRSQSNGFYGNFSILLKTIFFYRTEELCLSFGFHQYSNWNQWTENHQWICSKHSNFFLSFVLIELLSEKKTVIRKIAENLENLPKKCKNLKNFVLDANICTKTYSNNKNFI